MTEPISLSVKEAAELIGISERHAYNLAAKGDLPGAYRMGRRVLVHRPTLLAEVEAMATRVSRE